MEIKMINYLKLAEGSLSLKEKKIIENCVKGVETEIEESEVSAFPEKFCVEGNILQEKIYGVFDEKLQGVITYIII